MRLGNLIEPGDNPIKIDGRSSRNVLERSFGQSAIATAAQTKGSHALRNGAFDARSAVVQALACLGGLSLTCLLECLILRLWSEAQDAPAPFGAAGTFHAGLASLAPERHRNEWASGVVDALYPGSREDALGTPHLFVRPVDVELIKIIGLSLPFMRNVIHPARYQPRELLPASLLPYRKTWQPLIRSLPTNAYLIVTNLDNQLQNASLLRLVQLLHRQGEAVYVLSVGGADII